MARTRTNTKLNPHVTPSQPRPQRWEASALTTTPSLLPPTVSTSIFLNTLLKWYREVGTGTWDAGLPNAWDLETMWTLGCLGSGNCGLVDTWTLWCPERFQRPWLSLLFLLAYYTLIALSKEIGRIG